MTAGPVDQLAEAMDITEQLLAGVREDQWLYATPCSEWTVRELVDHVVGGNRLFARILTGQPMPPPQELGRRQGLDQLGEAPVAAYRTSTDELLTAYRQPGVLEQMFAVPIGTVPGIATLQLRLTEVLTHGWDLAQATGQPASYPDELAEQALAFSRRSLGQLPPGRTPFGTPQPVADDARPLDQLVALLGRQVLEAA